MVRRWLDPIDLGSWRVGRPARTRLLSGYCPAQSHSGQFTTIDDNYVAAVQPHNSVGGHHQPFPRDRSPAYRPARPIHPPDPPKR